MENPLGQHIHTVYTTCLLALSSHLGSQISYRRYHSACVQVALFYLILAPMCKCSDADDSEMPKRRCKVRSVSEKGRMYRKQYSAYRVWNYMWFQAPTGSLGMYSCG